MIVAVVGKTSSGKDSVANYINENYGIPIICSYTTRPKRKYEVDGIHHYFVSKEEMAKLTSEGGIIAYTKNPTTEIEYCATANSVDSDDMVYIINPDGIEWFKQYGDKNLTMSSIFIYSDEEEILRRGDLRGDDSEVLRTRLSSERAEFDACLIMKGYDYLVYNIADMESLFRQVDVVMSLLGFKKKAAKA